MSKTKKTLEKVLEYILEGEEDKAAELIHEYVVAKAKAKYQSILDEDEEVDETIDRFNDIESELTDDEDEIEADSIGEDDEFGSEFDPNDPEYADDSFTSSAPSGDEMDTDMGGDEVGMDDMEGGEPDLADTFDKLEDDLEELRAAFDQIIGGGDEFGSDDAEEIEADDEFGGEVSDDDMGFSDDDEEMYDSVSYDLDEEIEEIEEATQFQFKASQQHKTGGFKGSEDDRANNKSPFTNAPKPTVVKNGNTGPVVGKDGGDGNNRSLSKDGKTDATNHNIKVDHKAAPIQHKKSASMPNTADDGKVTSPVPKSRK